MASDTRRSNYSPQEELEAAELLGAFKSSQPSPRDNMHKIVHANSLPYYLSSLDGSLPVLKAEGEEQVFSETFLPSKPRNQNKFKLNSSRWTPKEDERLRSVVGRFGEKSWHLVAENMSGDPSSLSPSQLFSLSAAEAAAATLRPNHHTAVQCMCRWKNVLSPEVRKGPWTEEEDHIVRDLVAEAEGPEKIKWRQVAEHLSGRLGKQCRERWFNQLDPSINTGQWTPDEDQRLLEAQKKFGNRWIKIAKMLKGRTENAVKNRYNSVSFKRWKDAVEGCLGLNTKDHDFAAATACAPGGVGGSGLLVSSPHSEFFGGEFNFLDASDAHAVAAAATAAAAALSSPSSSPSPSGGNGGSGSGGGGHWKKRREGTSRPDILRSIDDEDDCRASLCKRSKASPNASGAPWDGVRQPSASSASSSTSSSFHSDGNANTANTDSSSSNEEEDEDLSADDVDDLEEFSKSGPVGQFLPATTGLGDRGPFVKATSSSIDGGGSNNPTPVDILRQQLTLVRQQRADLETRESHLRAAIQGLETHNEFRKLQRESHDSLQQRTCPDPDQIVARPASTEGACVPSTAPTFVEDTKTEVVNEVSPLSKGLPAALFVSSEPTLIKIA
mmetsp:Transcript_31388/g.63725  ORF Transcript_31388/g.63725 Transcript_31388/m.63725 type:complete len:613 (-) Transcript_31388:98-1936(-)